MVVVTLGHRLEGPSVHPQLRGRVDVAVETFRETDAPYLILSGGVTNPDVPKAECEVMSEYAIECGVDPDDVLLDKNAQDTKGNGYFTRLIVDDLDVPVDTVHVVSACSHMPRARYIFEQCFADAYDVDTRHCFELNEGMEMDFDGHVTEHDRVFFENVMPGDLDMIRRRLAESHDYYDWLRSPLD